MKWAIKLAPYKICCEPRRAIKAQALVDFIAECSTLPHLDEPQVELDTTWMLYVDGSITKKSSGAALIIVSLEGHTYEDELKFLFKTSNNEAEYKALLAVDLAKFDPP